LSLIASLLGKIDLNFCLWYFILVFGMAVVKVQDRRSKGEWTRTIRQNNTTAKIRPLFEKWRNYGRRTEKRGDERSLPERGSTELGDVRRPNYEIDVPMRGMDDWALWSFLENTFGENGGFNVVVSLLMAIIGDCFGCRC
jgi:hypothetical protein